MTTVTIPGNSSIQSAINANPAGTVFQLAAETYYGAQFEPKANDQFIGDASGGSILSGAVVLNDWTQSGDFWLDGNVPAQVSGQVVSGSNPLSSALNDLFIDNKLYTRVGSLSQVTSGTWYYNSSDNSAYISDNPTGQTVEMSTTSNMTYDNGTTGVAFQNLTIEKYATDAQTGAIQGGSDWQLNNVTMTHNHGAGLNIGSGTVVQGGSYSGNGQIGIEGLNAANAEVLNATIDNNNYAGYDNDWDAGGLKMIGSANVVVSGNTVSDNNGKGIWADIDSVNWTISNNTVTNNDSAGIQYEISHGAAITGNTLSGNNGFGIQVQTSDNVTVSGNTVTVGANNTGISTYTADGGIDIVNLARGYDPYGFLYQTINDAVINNTIIHTTDTSADGIFYETPIVGSANNVWNNNTYYVPNTTVTYWFFGNTFYTWIGLHQTTPYETTGTDIVGSPPAATTSALDATSSDTAAITASSLAAGTATSGMSFIASTS